jgi:hypothetical protein
LNARASPPLPHDATRSSELSVQLASATLKSPTFERSIPVRSMFDAVKGSDAAAASEPPPPAFFFERSHDATATGRRRRASVDDGWRMDVGRYQCVHAVGAENRVISSSCAC